MRKLSDKYPDDVEAQTFYALAVLAVGYATPTDTTLANQLKAADILEKLWKKNPQHPGIVHYLIHSYDYPAFAERGLAAARSYSSIAPWVPHALHMPSHIFTRLGMWEDSIAANRSSSEASRAYAKKRHRDATEAEELHALDYMTYSYLQEGQDAEARRWWISSLRYAKPIPSWNSVRPMRWPRFRRVMRSSAMPGLTQQRCAFRQCRTGLHFRSWKP